jgi:O-antigen/teichoic acid export membrane protein
MQPFRITKGTPAGASSLFVERVRQAIKRIWKDVEIIRLARNVAWSSFGVVLSQVITLVAYMALARFIGKERFGEFTIIQSTANTVSAFAGLGFGITATKYIAQLRQRYPIEAGSVMGLISLITLLWTGLLTVVIWASATEIATELLKRPELASAVRIGAVLLFFTAIMNVQNGALAGFESFDAVAKTSMLRGFLILPFLLAGAALGGVRGALAGFASAGALVCLVNYNLLRRRCRSHSIVLHLRDGIARLRLLAGFSIPAFLANILPAPCLSVAQMLLIRQPGGYGDLAVFTAAFQLRAGIVLLPAILSQPLVPMFAGFSEANLSSRKNLLRATCAATVVVSIFLATIVCAFPKYLMLAYGHSFTENSPVLILLAISAVIFSVSNPFISVAISAGKMWTIFMASAAWGVTFLVTTHFLLPALHATALACAYVAADSVQAVFVFIAYHLNEKTRTASLAAETEDLLPLDVIHRAL